MRDQYSTLDIVKVLGIPRERLRDWLNRGFIYPSIQKAKGQGTKALFSRNDVYRIALFRKLIKIGFKRDWAAKLTILFTVGKKGKYIIVAYSDKDETGYYLPQKGMRSTIDYIFKDREGTEYEHVLIVNLKKIRDEVDTALLTLEE